LMFTWILLITWFSADYHLVFCWLSLSSVYFICY